jgi:hypothetical protein
LRWVGQSLCEDKTNPKRVKTKVEWPRLGKGASESPVLCRLTAAGQFLLHNEGAVEFHRGKFWRLCRWPGGFPCPRRDLLAEPEMPTIEFYGVAPPSRAL